MEITYYKHYSLSLGRDVEFKSYGCGGQPVIFIPCQDGRFFDFENYRMIDVWAPYLENGDATVFSIDTIDKETWSDKWGNAEYRSELYERWISYICYELVPFIRDKINGCYGEELNPRIMLTGSSLGATHALNIFLRRPDLFGGALALSGIYTSEYGFGTYMDEKVYNNSPLHYLPNMPADHPYINMYNNSKIIICSGQGPWEIPESTRRIDEIFKSKGIKAWVDFWGFDVAHDWPWWYKQAAYFIPYLLGKA